MPQPHYAPASPGDLDYAAAVAERRAGMMVHRTPGSLSVIDVPTPAEVLALDDAGRDVAD